MICWYGFGCLPDVRWYRNAPSWQSPRRTTKAAYILATILATKAGKFSTIFLQKRCLWIPSDRQYLAGEWMDLYVLWMPSTCKYTRHVGIRLAEAYYPPPCLRCPNVPAGSQASEGTHIFWPHIATLLIAAIAKINVSTVSATCIGPSPALCWPYPVFSCRSPGTWWTRLRNSSLLYQSCYRFGSGTAIKCLRNSLVISTWEG